MSFLMRAAIPIAAAAGAAVWVRLLRRSARPAGAETDLSQPGSRPRVVVLGGGFGGLSAAMALTEASDEFEVVLVDQHNFHLFTPLLYQVAVGLVDSRSITYPLRALAYRCGMRFVLAEARGF